MGGGGGSGGWSPPIILALWGDEFMAGSCVLQRGLRHFSFGGGGGLGEV